LSTRQEPILWIQLLGLGFIPLEFLLLKLVLAGAPVGPIPTIQRIIIMVIAIITPTIVLFKNPADWASFLFFKLPLKGRSVSQHQINNLQLHFFLPKICFLAGVIILISCFWFIDKSALLLADISPFHNFSRIINLFFAIPLLFLIVWQWHQLCFSIWLLTRSEDILKASEYLPTKQILANQLCLGLDAKCFSQLNFSSSSFPTAVNKNQSSKKD